MAQERILVVEDEPSVSDFMRNSLERLGYICSGCFANGQQAVRAAEESRPDLVLMDIGLDGDMDGIEAAGRIHSRLNIPVMYVTADTEHATLARAMETEPVGYVVKPFQPIDLKTAIETALRQRDVSRRRAEEAAHQAELKYRALFEGIAEGIFRSSAEGRFLVANPALASMLGYSTPEELFSSINDIRRQLYANPDRRIEFQRTLEETGSVQGFESEVYRKDGSTLWIRENVRAMRDSEGKLLWYDGTIEDITDRKKTERERDMMEIQLRHAMKLEAVGQLAAGIAHEINTPTQYVGDNTRFLQDAFGDIGKVLSSYERLLQSCLAGSPDPGLVAEVQAVVQEADLDYLAEEIPKAISQSLDGVSRVATIVRAMKEFSHPGGDEKQAIDLNHAIQSTITVCRNEWKYVAEMVVDFDSSLPLVPCLPGEFNQVILNLIVNAAHAIGDVVGNEAEARGAITVSTRRAGDLVEIRVSDTGTGIAPEARDKIFTPFFTTKKVGKGTGQGLAISHAVVVGKHNGTIDFETEVGKGTTFIIHLPLAADAS